MRTSMLKIPELNNLPPYTDAANVQENITNWIDKGMMDKIKLYTRPDKTTESGYRFVDPEDFNVIKNTAQVISGIVLDIKYSFIHHRTDVCFCPLIFGILRIDIEISHKGNSIEFTTDAALKRFIKQIKSN